MSSSKSKGKAKVVTNPTVNAPMASSNGKGKAKAAAPPSSSSDSEDDDPFSEGDWDEDEDSIDIEEGKDREDEEEEESTGWCFEDDAGDDDDVTYSCATLDTDEAIEGAVKAIRSLPTLEKRLQGCIAEDEANGLLTGAERIPRVSELPSAGNTIVDYSALTTADLAERLTKVAQGLDAFNWPSDLLVDASSPIPPAIQRLENAVERMRALHGSIDKRDQLCESGRAAHVAGNMDITTVTDNLSKGGMVREARDLIDLAVYVSSVARHIDLSGVAVLLNRIEAINLASINRTRLTDDQRQRFTDELRDLRSFLSGDAPSWEWRSALPPPSIASVLRSYPSAATDQIEAVESSLKSTTTADLVRSTRARVLKYRHDAPELVLNSDGVPVLFFGASTTTRELAKLVCGITLRYLTACGKRYAATLQDLDAANLPPIHVFLHLVEATLELGYVRQSGQDGRPVLLGTRDGLSGLPHVHGGISSSVGKVTYLSHEAHGVPVSFGHSLGADVKDHGNHGFESFPVNCTRRSWRFATLVAHLRSRRPALQSLVNKLAPLGVISPFVLPDFKPSDEMTAAWANNHVSPVEAVLQDSEFVGKLRSRVLGAEKEVALGARNRADAQRQADAEAARLGKALFQFRCKTCRTAITSPGDCATCRRDTSRMQTYEKTLHKFEGAEAVAKESRLVKEGARVGDHRRQRPDRRVVTHPTPAYLMPSNKLAAIGFGLGEAPNYSHPPPRSFYGFKCDVCQREREGFWTVDAKGRTSCWSCWSIARREEPAFQSRYSCYECGVGRCREWRRGPVPGAMICLPCWGSRFTCHCGATKSSFWYLQVGHDDDDRECDTCYRKRIHGFRPRVLKAKAAVCLYPGCDVTSETGWRWWPKRRKVGRICNRHRTRILENDEERAALTALLDAARDSVSPASLKDRFAQEVEAANLKLSSAGGKRKYTKKDKPANAVDQYTVVSQYPVQTECTYPGCSDSQSKLAGWPGLTKVGKVCVRHQSVLARKKAAEEKLELTNLLAQVASSPPKGSLKDDFTAAVAEAGIELSASGEKRVVKAKKQKVTP